MKLTIPPGPHRAYLFDMDGTVADSMPLHYIAWKQALILICCSPQGGYQRCKGLRLYFVCPKASTRN